MNAYFSQYYIFFLFPRPARKMNETHNISADLELGAKPIFISQHNTYRICNFQFKRHVSLEMIREVLAPYSATQRKQVFKTSQVYRYDRDEIIIIKELLQFMEQWDHGFLALKFKIGDDFLEKVASIHFSNLRVLDLEQNQIASVERIQNLNAPFLDCLKLKENRISTVISLRKAHLPNLSRLSIDLIDSRFSSAYFPKLQLVESRKKQTLSWVAKMQSLRINRIVAHGYGYNKDQEKNYELVVKGSLRRRHKMMTVE